MIKDTQRENYNHKAEKSSMRAITGYLLTMGILMNFHSACSAQDSGGSGDRKPVVAGKFYPSDPKELTAMLTGLFREARPGKNDEVAAIVVPHAGYVFSGRVAASGYNQVDPDRTFDNVFVIASSHRVSFNGASVYNRGDYLTPLGKVPVNREIANRLISEHPVFTFRPDADLTEHSLEVQIPFLQHHLKRDFQLVPIVLGTQDERSCKEIAAALRPWFTSRNLFVFSTDFSHYPSDRDARRADSATCDAIRTGSPDRLLAVLKELESQNIPNFSTGLCGWTSVLVFLHLCRSEQGIAIQPVEYMNSGDSKYGDRSQVVGYWSLAALRDLRNRSEGGISFTEEEKRYLLTTAREAVESCTSGTRTPSAGPPDGHPSLLLEAGAFVTLKKHGELRGCLGRFTSDIPLYRLVREMAIASATQDSRFTPVRRDEVKALEIEISVLTPMKKIDSIREIILGTHGIYLKKGSRSGTFLPQVATETGWSLEEFLGHCARDKAGIGWDGWKEAEIFVYEAIVLSEDRIIDRKY